MRPCSGSGLGLGLANRALALALAQHLTLPRYAAEALHGGLSQQVRGRRLAALRAAELRVLVATNVAARGLDVASLEAVVNYELPRSTADYTHRVGRTGRAGEAGLAVSFITSTGPVTLTVTLILTPTQP